MITQCSPSGVRPIKLYMYDFDSPAESVTTTNTLCCPCVNSKKLKLIGKELAPVDKK